MALKSEIKNLSTSQQNLTPTIGVGQEGSLHSLTLGNGNASTAVTTTLTFFDSSQSADSVFLIKSVSANTTFVLDKPLNLEQGDIVKGSAAGTGIVSIASTFVSDSTAPIATGIDFQGEFTSTQTYSINQSVSKDGTSFVSRTNSNTGNTPNSSPSNWQILSSKGDTGTGFDGSGNASASGQLNIGTVSSTALISDADGNLRDIPLSGSIKSDAYTLAVGDAGNHVVFNSANVNFTVPASTFDKGDIVSIISTNGSTATVSSAITNMFVAEGASATATATIGANGVASILFLSASYAVLTGNIS
jgi:hypothetical protein